MINTIVVVFSLVIYLSLFAVEFFSKQMLKDIRKLQVPVRIRSNHSRK